MKIKDKGNDKLRVLYLEDSVQDVDIIRETLRESWIKLELDYTETEQEFVSFLHRNTYDVILSDFKLPVFDAFGALRRVLDICPAVPFICVSGTVGEETAVELVRQGAVDYVLKDRLTRLPVAIRRALDEATEKELRRQAEEALRESEEKFRRVIETALEGVWFLDREFKTTEVNDAIVSMLGYTPEELLGRPFIDFVSDEDRPMQVQEFQQRLRGISGQYERRLRCKDGSVKWMYFSAKTIMNAQGAFAGTFAMVTDISERKQAENQISLLAHTLKSVAECVSITDLNDIVLFVNNAFLKTYGYTENEILGKNITLVRSPNNPPEAARGILDATLDGGWSGELTNRTKDGRDFPVSLSTSFVRDEQGQDIALVGIATDITERKRAEQAVRDSEKRFRAIFDQAPIAFALLDLQGRPIISNLPLSKMVGYSKDELSKMKFTDFTYSEDVDKDLKQFAALLEGKIPRYSMEKRYVHKNGTLVWANLFVTILRDENGNPWEILGMAEDITERKRAEEELKKSEEKYRSIFENVQDVYYESAIDGTILEISPSIEIVSKGQYRRNDLIGKSMNDFYSHIEERQVILSALHERGNVSDYEVTIKNRDGSQIPCSISAKIYFDAEGHPEKIIGSMRDISERKRAEENVRKLSRAVEQSPASVIITNTKGDIEYVNPKFTQLTGYTSEEAIGKNPRILRSGYTQQEEYSRLWETIQSGREWHGEFHNKKKNGELYWESASISPIFDEIGTVTHFLAVKEDITEKKKMQNQLLQSQKVQSIGTLAGGIAHDFNNILGIILAYTSMLERSEGDKDTMVKSTAAITQAVSRGAALVRQILTFARQTGALIKPILIPDLIRELVVMLQETFPEVIEFQMTIEKNVPLVNADQTQMHQVLLNLCVNARDALPKGGIIGIDVKTITSETLVQQFPGVTGDRYVSITVSDTGIGMDEATRCRIFDPFFTTKEQGKGTGLGLSVVYGVIQEHHGFIAVESKVGQGTTFRLYLPVPKEEKKIQDIQKIRTDVTLGGSETILLVEDEELLREVVQSTLEANGYKVLIATNGREAVEIYKKQYKSISLVLNDMGLPKLRGIDEFALLKEINPDVKVIFASGFMSLETRSELIIKGAKGFIQKPYNMDEVLQMVREVLNGKSS